MIKEKYVKYEYKCKKGKEKLQHNLATVEEGFKY